MKISPSVEIKRTDTGLEYLNVQTEFCSAKIMLQGAQIVSFQPTNQPPLLWVSEHETWQEGQGVRGGIPICWPWFGVHKNPEWPIHGIARKIVWRAEQVNEDAEQVIIKMSLPNGVIDQQYWPYDTKLEVEFRLTNRLKVSLTTTNLTKQSIQFSQALHSYLPTDDIKQTKVHGLQGSQYIEFGEGPFQQNDVVEFHRETDMVYFNAPKEQHIEMPQGTMVVARENSRSCILWNPWIDKSKRLSCFGDNEYHKMLCLEAGNVLEDIVELPAGESYTLATELYWQQ